MIFIEKNQFFLISGGNSIIDGPCIPPNMPKPLIPPGLIPPFPFPPPHEKKFE